MNKIAKDNKKNISKNDQNLNNMNESVYLKHSYK